MRGRCAGGSVPKVAMHFVCIAPIASTMRRIFVFQTSPFALQTSLFLFRVSGQIESHSTVNHSSAESSDFFDTTGSSEFFFTTLLSEDNHRKKHNLNNGSNNSDAIMPAIHAAPTSSQTLPVAVAPLLIQTTMSNAIHSTDDARRCKYNNFNCGAPSLVEFHRP